MSGAPTLFFLIIPIIIFLIIWGILQSARRRKEIAAWAASKGLRFSEMKDHGMKDRFPDYDCLKQGDDRYALNIIEGDWAGRPILAFDYHYETHSTDSKGNRQTHNHYFSAVILDSGLHLKPLFLRPEGLFDKLKGFFGFEDINFESAEFSRKFYVKAQDRKWAYDVIHARAMEYLLAAPRFSMQFSGRHVIAYTASTFTPAQFESAAETIRGLLDLLPQYVLDEIR
jgi:hypothetical protein